ncbi:MAG TPA: hypothetical protein VKQ72_23035 [Aggregatilineales bacterium]|nr:hypothetical protein [Aggregatilineales bacterium]
MNSRSGVNAESAYGLTHSCFATSKAQGEFIVVGGVGAQSIRWARVLSWKAAQKLWYQLAECLFPEQLEQVMGIALRLAIPMQPTIGAPKGTFDVVALSDSNLLDIRATLGETTWRFRLGLHDAHFLWAALDLALYPGGWQGDLAIKKSS